MHLVHLGRLIRLVPLIRLVHFADLADFALFVHFVHERNERNERNEHKYIKTPSCIFTLQLFITQYNPFHRITLYCIPKVSVQMKATP